MLGGGSRPPQRLHHMLGGGWGVERSAPPSLEAMCACSKAKDAYLRVVPDEAGLCGEIARYNRLVKFVVVVEGCASACGARTF